MIPAPPYPREKERQEALLASGILLIDHEERFQRIIRLARRLFNVPIAMLSLADNDTQRFRACVGLDFESAPRELSFCSHAILQPGCFVVPDARLDERFARNPYVTTEPGVRFYAGRPLFFVHEDEPQPLGTICLVDMVPRSFTPDDEATLDDLAVTVENEIVQYQHATQDELTGLLNRRGLLLDGQSVQHRRRIELEQPAVTCLFFDLDGLKPINDLLGHDVGDAALIAFAEALQSVCRATDPCGRIGGDEFVVLFTNANPKATTALLSRLDDAIARHNAQETRYTLRYSVGAYEWEPGRSLASVLKVADKAMYDQKQAKKKQQETA